MWSGSYGFKICITWPQGYNPKMQTIKVHRQGTCLVLCLSPLPYSDQPKDGHRWHGHGWGLLSLLSGPSLEYAFSMHSSESLIQASRPMSSVTTSHALLQTEVPLWAPRRFAQFCLCPPVPGAFLCLCSCRHAQDDLAGSKSLEDRDCLTFCFFYLQRLSDTMQ